MAKIGKSGCAEMVRAAKAAPDKQNTFAHTSSVMQWPYPTCSSVVAQANKMCVLSLLSYDVDMVGCSMIEKWAWNVAFDSTMGLLQLSIALSTLINSIFVLGGPCRSQNLVLRDFEQALGVL